MSAPTATALAAALVLTVLPNDPGDSNVTAGTDAFDVKVEKYKEPGQDNWVDSLKSGAGATGEAGQTSEAPGKPTPPPAITCEADPSSPTGYTTHVHGGAAGHNGFGAAPSGTLGPCEPPESDEARPARITPGMVLQAFRRIPLPAAELDIQPPGGKTLVNLDTIFSTTAGDLERTVTLLGRQVHLRITPSTYTWHHGDGTTQTSDWPGRPWENGLEDMSAYLTHVYADADVTVRPSVDVTYSAEFRLGNGPWQPVAGTVTIDGPPSALRVLEARPVLTGAGRP